MEQTLTYRTNSFDSKIVSEDALPHRLTHTRVYNQGPRETHNSLLERVITYTSYALIPIVGLFIGAGIMFDLLPDTEN